jgi:hypothetical protein
MEPHNNQTSMAHNHPNLKDNNLTTVETHKLPLSTEQHHHSTNLEDHKLKLHNQVMDSVPHKHQLIRIVVHSSNTHHPPKDRPFRVNLCRIYKVVMILNKERHFRVHKLLD